MNRYACDQEQRILAALRSGAWEDDLREHAKDCPFCADVLIVSEFLRQEAVAATAEPPPIGAGLLWWKSQLWAREIAVRKATRPITVAINLATLLFGAALLWFLNASAQTRDGIATRMSEGHLSQILWSGDLLAFALALGGSSILCVLLGSLYLLWAEK
jgi:hypothetical protein